MAFTTAAAEEVLLPLAQATSLLLGAYIVVTTVSPSPTHLIRLGVVALIRTFLNHFLGRFLGREIEAERRLEEELERRGPWAEERA